jgi:sterol desaturase/sphingolipid hydroxylase (fatty acid hydroxylase superfamily)
MDLLTSIGAIDTSDVEAFMKFWFTGTGAILGLVLAAEILIRLFSWIGDRHTPGRKRLISKDAPANFVLALHAFIIEGAVGLAAEGGAAYAGASISHWHIPFNGYTIILYFLAAEFYHYIYHRLGHEVRFLWADHSIHHSSRDYEFFTSWRLTPGTWLYKVATIMPIAMLGFGPIGLLLMAKGISFQTFIHTQRIGRLGWFDQVFCSPANHSIHHACNARYIDKNYGGGTMIWDQFFGTFILPGEEKIKFGITRDVASHNPFKIWSFEFGHLIRDAWYAPTLKDKLVVLFGRPGETYSFKPKAPKADDLSDLEPGLVAAE